MRYEPYEITEIISASASLRTFLFDKKIDAIPGQFVIAWLPGVSEKPFSLSSSSPLGITVRKLGTFTSRLFDLEVGSRMMIRGPYGNGFPMDVLNSSHNVFIVGGGTGMAPLALLVENIENASVTSFLGAKTSEEVLFKDRFSRAGKTYISTEDGSLGDKGLVTDLISRYANDEGAKAAVCGPELMLANSAKVLSSKVNPSGIYVSLERYMKCGMGLCGSCDFGGYRICVDGPVFPYEQIKEIDEFGKFSNDRTGRKREI